MTELLHIGSVSAERGSVSRGGIPVDIDLRGGTADIPIIVCRGVQDGPVLWLNGATHGDEPEGAFSIFKLLELIDPRQLNGTIVGVPAINVPAFAAGTRGNPADTFSYDMNRIYPGSAEGYPTERTAWAHWTAMEPICDLQIAIHSGGDHSYLAHMIFASDNPQSLELAGGMGPQWDLVFRAPTGAANPSSKIAELGKAGITVELGGNCRSLTNDFDIVAADLAGSYVNVLRHYGMIEGEAQYARSWRMGHQQALLAPASGMFVGNADLRFEEPIDANTLLGEIYNLHGMVAAEVRAPCDGVVFGLRSRPSVFAGEWCCFFGIIDETRDDLLSGASG